MLNPRIMKNAILTGVALLIAVISNGQSPCNGLPVININATNTTPCDGERIMLTATGGNTFQWNNGVINGVSFVPAAPGNYWVTVTDVNGCKDSASIFIDILPIPNVVASSSSTEICLGDSVLLDATGAVSYSWTNPVIPNGTYYTPPGIGPNTFTVEGTAANGCTNTSQVAVLVNPIPDQPILNQDYISTCLDVAFDGDITGSSFTGRVIWFNDSALTNMYIDQPELELKNTPVGVEEYWATSFENGCYSPPVKATVEVFDRPGVDAGPDVLVEAGARGELEAVTTSTTGVPTWTPDGALNDPLSLITGYTARNTTMYQITLVDGNNCVSVDSVLLEVKSDLIISNLMTPDGNGENDTWLIYPEITLSTCNVKLYDGFGRELISTDNYANDWDGIHEGEAVPEGDYYYYIKCGNGFSKKGTLTILR